MLVVVRRPARLKIHLKLSLCLKLLKDGLSPTPFEACVLANGGAVEVIGSVAAVSHSWSLVQLCLCSKRSSMNVLARDADSCPSMVGGAGGA